jgi:hypothetical protein
MKCNICDAPLPEPKFVPGVKGSFDPCDRCMAVIEETLAGYDDSYLDRPAAAEEELGGPDPILEEFYPTSYEPFGE